MVCALQSIITLGPDTFGHHHMTRQHHHKPPETKIPSFLLEADSDKRALWEIHWVVGSYQIPAHPQSQELRVEHRNMRKIKVSVAVVREYQAGTAHHFVLALTGARYVELDVASLRFRV